MLEIASFRPVKDVFARLAQSRPKFSEAWVLEALVSLREQGVSEAEWRTIRQEIYRLHLVSAPHVWNRGTNIAPGQLGRTLNSMLLRNEVDSRTVPNSSKDGPQIKVLWSIKPPTPPVQA